MKKNDSHRLLRKGLLLVLLLALMVSLTALRPATAEYCYGPLECPPDMYWSCSSCYCYCPDPPGEPIPWGTCGACT